MNNTSMHNSGLISNGLSLRGKASIFLIALACVFYPVSYSLDAQQQEGQDSADKKQTEPPQSPDKKQQAAPQKSIEEERLSILRADIQKEIESLKKLRKDLEDVRGNIDQKKQESLARVAKIFESMTPEDAARRIEKLDEATAVVILNALKPKSAGKILAQIGAELAASISKKILARDNTSQEKTSR